MSRLEGRLDRLEASGFAGRCPGCGRLSGETQPAGIAAYYPDGRRTENFPDDPDELCGRCGKPLWAMIRVLHEDAEDAA